MKEKFINRKWFFYKDWDDSIKEAVRPSGFEEVTLPHSVVSTPFNYFDEHIYQMVSGYRYEFATEELRADKKVYLKLDGAAHEATVFINGEQIACHKNGYTAFVMDLTDHLMPEGEMNVVAVRLDSRESLNQPPFGFVIDYMTYGGLTRGASLIVGEKLHIDDLFVKTTRVRHAKSRLKIVTSLSEPAPSGMYLTCHVTDENGEEVASHKQPVKEGVSRFVSEWDVRGIKPWRPGDPALYYVRAELSGAEGVKDDKTVRFGFRDIRFDAGGLYVNGEKITVRGLNRHQCFAYEGYAMPDSIQRLDADILKNELHVNAVRTSHYPQAQSFIDRCDELGLLVFMEIPGWQHVGNEEWKEQACENVKEMILQYRNHPSIFIWGVRINESQDDHDLYAKTNRIAHELDSTRPTGGVRFLQKSELLEDVYTYNDFLHNGTNRGVSKKKDVTTDMSKGYIITENNGHMFPTKSFDDEEHRLAHMLRHARVMNDMYEEDDIAGEFAWCMFDYNTHRDFGSGDRICYHGVMDMFRNPKLAAYLWASQGDEEDVFAISSTLDIGEHPAGQLTKLYALTNADSVRMYKNDEFVAEFYPDVANFASLPHPPVLIDDFVGDLIEKHEPYTKAQAAQIHRILLAVAKYGMNSLPLAVKAEAAKMMVVDHITMEEANRLYGKYIGNWGGEALVYRFEAVKDGKVVGTIIKSAVTEHHPVIKVSCEKNNNGCYALRPGNGWDAAAVRMTMNDQNGNVLPYYQESAVLSAEGAVSVIGPAVVPFRGGMTGTYVRTNGSTGKGRLIIDIEGKKETVEFEVADN
ncbi:MAG: glycoside hydrolase family 2 protein [Lachnospiraceae bacterium]|nr:glycoside hydrolase family 2 protein [Lachnospiraceae bacterium]